MATSMIRCKLPADAAPRLGYSLLELMIALVLLVALLTAGWSMLATYRDAEQRGWRVVENTQLVRVSHDWLRNDLLHIAVSDRESMMSVSSGLVGTSLGFTAFIAPSVDPTAFFERMLNPGQEELASSGPGNQFTLDHVSGTWSENNLPSTFTKPLWPLDRIQIEYQLLQSSEVVMGGEVVPVYNLVRRERAEPNQLPQVEKNARQSTEQLLTIDDLYRQSDSTTAANLTILQENQLPNLTNAMFWYGDGTEWKPSWSDRDQLPTAVALTFDFAPRGNSGSIRATSTDFTASPSDQLGGMNLEISLPTVGEVESSSSSDSFELIERDVRLIVALQRQSKPKSISPVGISRSPVSDFGVRP